MISGCRINRIPIVRSPDIAGRVDSNVRNHLYAAARKPVNEVAGPGAFGMSFGIVSGEQHGGAILDVSDPHEFCGSMMTSNGDAKPATFTIFPSLIRPPGKYSN